MASRSDGSAIKALFPPIKGDSPTKKKKNKSPSSKNASPPDQSIMSPSPHKNTPLPDQSMKSSSPHKNAPPPDQNVNSPISKNVPPSDQNIKSPLKNINSPRSIDDKKEKENNETENIWKAPLKIQVDVNNLLQWAKAISSQVQEHGLMFNLEEVRQDQKKRTVSVFVMDKWSRKIVKPAKDMVLCQLSSLGVKVQAIIAGTSYAFWDILLPTIKEAVTLTKKP